MPPQHNPYAQTPPGAPSGPYGPPQPAYYGAPQQPGTAPAGTSRGGAGKAVLWAVVGAVVASAAWGGVMLLGKSGKPDLRGYTSTKNLCAKSDLSAFKTEYPKTDTTPDTYISDRPSLVQMFCSEDLDKESDDSSSDSGFAYVSVEADLHRKSDPGAEFGDHWKSFGDHGPKGSNYKVTAVDGFGDEAYVVTEDNTAGSSREVVLGVRDGGMTFTLSWNAYSSSTDDNSDPLPTLDQATEWVKSATKATMAKLK